MGEQERSDRSHRPSPFVTGSVRSDEHDVVRRLADATRGRDSLQQLPAFAAQLLGTSSAHVAFLSDIQEVQGGVGLGAQAIGLHTAVDDSMCSVTVAARGVTAIDDAVDDPRVASMPPVTSGQVRSYLGVPLEVRGIVVGAFCVFDAEPRSWSSADGDLLRRLAAPIAAELELAALGIEHESERLLWQLAVDAAEVGAFDWYLETDELRWDDRLLEIFGLDAATFGGTIAAFNDAVHPEDRDRVTAALRAAIDTCGVYSAEYRIHRPDGSVRWISARGRALAGPDGTAARVVGAASDTTAAVEGEASVRRVLEAMPAAFFHLDAEWRLAYLNSQAATLMGATAVELVGADFWELFPDTVGSELERHYRGAVTSGVPVQFEAYLASPLDRWYDVRAWPTPDGLSVYLVDATSRREAETALALGRERAELLGGISEALVSTLQPEAAAAQLARLVVGPLADWSIVSLIDHPVSSARPHGSDRADWGWRRGLHDTAAWHHDPDRMDVLQSFMRLRTGALSDTSLLARAVLEDRPQVRTSAAAATLTDLVSDVAEELVGRLDPRSVAIFPLRARGRTLGLLSVFRGAERVAFTEADLEVLADIAVRAGLALDNTRLYAGQRDLAEGLQRILLTEPPSTPGLEVAVRYVPAAETAQVGGDWYDVFIDEAGDTVLAIGDVVGHDTAAAASMGQLRGLLRGIAVTTGAGPAEVLTRVDRAMRTLHLDTIATAVVARCETPGAADGAGSVRMVWANAGHPPPVVVLPDGAPTSLPDLAGVQLLLGLDPETPRQDYVVDLPTGAVVLLYTDGLVERRGTWIEAGMAELERRLTALVREGLALDELCDQVLRELLPPEPEDDVALVAIRVRPLPTQ